MIELLVHIPDDQAAELERVSRERMITREQIVEQAVTQYLTPERKPHPQDFFGTMPHLEDGMVFQERLRREWIREWDPEYEGEEKE